METAPAIPLFRFLPPGWVLPDFLTPQALQLWRLNGEAAEFWFELARESGFDPVKVAGRYGLSDRQTRRHWWLLFHLGLKDWLKRLSMAQAALWLYQGLTPADIAERLPMGRSSLRRDFRQVYNCCMTEFAICLGQHGSVPDNRRLWPWPKMSDRLAIIERGLSGPPKKPLKGALSNRLTAHERRITQLLAKGYDNARIAQETGTTKNTVRTVLKPIYRKLDVHTRGEALVKLLGLPKKWS
jgi:DNA-binding CsgD family transcriptional regulator